MYIYTLSYFYDANCFSQEDMVKLAYPCHSAGKMKAKSTVQNINERDLWHRYLIESSISLAKDLVYIGGVCPVVAEIVIEPPVCRSSFNERVSY